MVTDKTNDSSRRKEPIIFIILVLVVLFFILYNMFVPRTQPNSHMKALRLAKPKGQIVIYNRVRKSGSRTVLEVITTLSNQNDFQMHSSIVYEHMNLSLADQTDLMNYIQSLQPPLIFEKHVHYLDFTRLGYEPPIYINIIRDPIRRFVSDYYFARFGDALKIDKVFLGSDEAKNRSVNDCILGGYDECREAKAFGLGSIPYFCGQDPRCMQPSEWALEQALYNLHNRYLFVGITEHLKGSIAILEALLPNLFKGASKILKYHGGVMDVVSKSSTKGKHELTPAASKKLKEVLRLEYIFYNEAIRLFKDLKNQIKRIRP